ncbi:tyrosinase HcTyr2-like isoform X2 [Convolutriloba macropyga]|uniref:tyrosinase HcTyr2-like isoform X2 n=1 Tax=Convolutriloba macropyga TaxID=536237 RepID=UPI003F521394
MSHENKKAKMSNEKSPTAPKMTVRMSLHELEEAENSNRKNNFLKAWKRIKELPPTNPNSLWSIATFHGMPFKNDHQNHSENTKVWRSYCQHHNILFLTWHRFYCLRIEQALQTVVPEDEQGEDGQVALHYWDYFDQNRDPIPPLLVNETVLIDGKEEPNPLMNFVMPVPLEGYEPTSFYIKPDPGYRTVRYPFSGIYNPESAKKVAMEHNDYILSLDKTPSELFRENFETWLNYGLLFDGESIGHSLYFDASEAIDNPEFNSFSNRTSSEHRLGDIWKSVETVHDTVHLAIGGYTYPNVDPITGELDYFGVIQGSNGDMGENETASFDPCFYLHHCNMDRLFWVWQKKWNHTDDIQIDYSDPSDPGLTPAGGQGPSMYQKADQVLNFDTVLLPFQDELGVPRTSRGCINIETQLNCTYTIGSLDNKDWNQFNLMKQPILKYHKPIHLSLDHKNHASLKKGVPRGVPRTSRGCINIETQLNCTYTIGSLDNKDWNQFNLMKQPILKYHKPIHLSVTLDNMQKLEDDLKKAMATIDIVNVGAESSAGKPEQARETTNPAARRLHRIVLDITGLIRRTGSYIGDSTDSQSNTSTDARRLSPLLKSQSSTINILDGKAFNKKLHLVIRNINSEEFKGSFVVYLTQKMPPGGENGGQWKLVGHSGVLGRWEKSSCENCVHRKGKTVSFEINYKHTNQGEIKKEDFKAFVVTKDPVKHVNKIMQLDLFSRDEEKPKTEVIIKAVQVVQKVGLKRKADQISTS